MTLHGNPYPQSVSEQSAKEAAGKYVAMQNLANNPIYHGHIQTIPMPDSSRLGILVSRVASLNGDLQTLKGILIEATVGLNGSNPLPTEAGSALREQPTPIVGHLGDLELWLNQASSLITEVRKLAENIHGMVRR